MYNTDVHGCAEMPQYAINVREWKRRGCRVRYEC